MSEHIIDAAIAADTPDPVMFVMVDEHPRFVHTELVAQASAGAALAYAIYHAGVDFVGAMPDPVTKAYVKACAAYQIGGQYRVVGVPGD
jgi:hypothetical protein